MSRAVRITFGLVILAVVLATANLGAVATAIATADLALVIPGLALLVAVHVIPALAWRRMTVTRGGATMSRLDAIRVYYAAQALGGITPANLGGDVYRIAALRRSGSGVVEAALPVAVQRGTSFLALAGLGLLGVAGSAAPSSALVAVGLAALAATAIGVGSFVLISPPHAFGSRVGRRLDVGRGARVPAGLAAVGLASGLTFHLVAILGTWLILIGTTPVLAAPAVLAGIAAARLSLAVPLSPSGVGIGEGLLAALVATAGLPAPAAVAGLLVTRLALVATTLIGSALIATDARRRTTLGTAAGQPL